MKRKAEDIFKEQIGDALIDLLSMTEMTEYPIKYSFEIRTNAYLAEIGYRLGIIVSSEKEYKKFDLINLSNRFLAKVANKAWADAVENILGEIFISCGMDKGREYFKDNILKVYLTIKAEQKQHIESLLNKQK